MNLPFDIRVISLRKSIGRRVAIGRALVAAGMGDFTIHDAVDGVTLDLPAMHGNGSIKDDSTKGRPLLPGEVGATMSHRQVWEEVVRRGRPAMILEDDAHPAENAAAIIKSFMSRCPEDWDIVHLHSFFPAGSGQECDSGRVCVVKGPVSVWTGHNEYGGALAYLINPRTAQWLVEAASVIRSAVDGITSWVTAPWTKGFKGYVCDPFPFNPGMWRFPNVTDTAGIRPEVPQRYRFDHRDWFTSRTTKWHQWLGPMVGSGDNPMKVLEIGAFEGRSTVWMLENLCVHPDSGITVIDPWDDGFTMVGWRVEDMRRAKDNFNHNIKLTGLAGRLDVLAGQARQMLPGLPDGVFDFVYVDGSHYGPDVLFDLVVSFHKVKVGGVICIDDYNLTSYRRNVRDAADAFLTCFSQHVTVLDHGEQVTIRKTSHVEPIHA